MSCWAVHEAGGISFHLVAFAGIQSVGLHSLWQSGSTICFDLCLSRFIVSPELYRSSSLSVGSVRICVFTLVLRKELNMASQPNNVVLLRFLWMVIITVIISPPVIIILVENPCGILLSSLAGLAWPARLAFRMIILIVPFLQAIEQWMM